MKNKKNNPTQQDFVGIAREARERAHKKELEIREDKIKQLQSALDESTATLATLLDIENAPHNDVTIPVLSPGLDNEATVFAVASDWHVEEVVLPGKVNGLNEHNLTIADEKIKKFFQAIVKLTDINRHGVKIKHLVLGLLGDFISGYIHDELVESNEVSPITAIVWCLDRITAGLKFLEKEGKFETISIVCCDGNHGRTTKKTRSSTRTDNSYEHLMYMILARSFPQFKWDIAQGYSVYQEVYGRVIHWHHGDNIQYQGGIGGITISVNKAIAGWDKGRTAYLDIFGHHHTYQQNPKWVCNGSLIGYSPYSITCKAAYEPPIQTFFLMDAKRGRTGTWPIFVR